MFRRQPIASRSLTLSSRRYPARFALQLRQVLLVAWRELRLLVFDLGGVICEGGGVQQSINLVLWAERAFLQQQQQYSSGQPQVFCSQPCCRLRESLYNSSSEVRCSAANLIGCRDPSLRLVVNSAPGVDNPVQQHLFYIGGVVSCASQYV